VVGVAVLETMDEVLNKDLRHTDCADGPGTTLDYFKHPIEIFNIESGGRLDI